jgi:hypothetical protein
MQFATRFGRVLHFDAVVLAILIGSLGMNVYLGVTRQPTTQRVVPHLIAEGSMAPVLEGTSVSGVKVNLSYGKDPRSTLLYVFSPSCHWCERNLANIRAIVETRHDLRVIGINIGPRLDVKAARAQPFSEIVTPTSAVARAYGFGGTPSTVLVAPTGKVVKSWTGAYAGDVAREVSKALAVSLPGLSADSLAEKEN